MHIAIMMDGNGRWGTKQGLTRSQGHYAGAKAMEKIIATAVDMKITVLTLYAFSTENWKRPQEEVSYLMNLPVYYLREKLPEYKEKGIQVRVFGDREGLPPETIAALAKAEEETKENRSLFVNFAVNYGGRNELVHAMRQVVNYLQESGFDEVNEELINRYLYTKELPDPDIIIRTGGEKRLSNFLLWQSSTAELWFTNVLFPDFTPAMPKDAIKEVQC
ncbi:polyprenyl diphosphate synthase [Bacillus sp. JCM 19041]|uniref:polyprenyl diphosphate synthase n=1 Tax=Bacillus sp. JCM 19041 TaxID=1460637 RepID=UPI0006CF848F